MTITKIPKTNFLPSGPSAMGSESQKLGYQVPGRTKASGRFWGLGVFGFWLWWILEVSVNEWPSAKMPFSKF